METIFANIQNGLIFYNIRCGVFLKRFFAWNNYNVLAESFLVCFVQFYFFTQTDDFEKGYSPWMEAIFANIQNGLIFRIFGAF